MLLSALLRPTLAQLVNFLMPPCCFLCARPVARTQALCPSCWRQLHFITPPHCPITGVPFAHPWPDSMVSSRLGDGAPAFHRARMAFRYDGVVARQLIARFKYGDRPEIALLAAQWMARAGADLLHDADLMIPIPLHPARLAARRFNQAAELVRALSRITGKPAEYQLLHRNRRTLSQTGLNRRQRQRNVAGAFAVEPQSRPAVKGKTLLLVDDVMTSGATMTACARVLRAQGAKRVYVLALAGVILPHECQPMLPDPRLEKQLAL